MKFKSITNQMILLFGILLFVICVGLEVIAYFNSSEALQDSINENFTEIAEADALAISEKIEGQLNALQSLANSPWIKGDELSVEEKLELLQDEVKRSRHESIMLVGTDGIARHTTGTVTDIHDRDYYQQALAGKNAVSDPLISRVDGNLVVAFAVPIKQENKVTGVLVALQDGNALSAYTKDMQYNQREIFMINRKGTTVAHSDVERVLNMENVIEENQGKPEFSELIILLNKMVAGERGVGQYSIDGDTKYMAYCPVAGTNWSLALTAPRDTVMYKVDNLASSMIKLSAFFLFVGIGLTVLLANNISKPIKAATKHINVMSTGDFTADIPRDLLKKKDEIGVLANSLSKMQDSMRTMVKAVMDGCTDVGQMLSDINNNMSSLNESLEEISATTQQLSAGTEETAASSEEMNATSQEVEKAIESIASKAQEGATTVNKISKLSEKMRESAISSKQEALEIYSRTKADLQNAIEQSKAVHQINELSNAILDITSQTNLLALNAAIEAARAGEAGQGFAVVAEEIRKLAEGSKNSVSQIKEVTNKVLEVVNALSSSSTEIIEFIDKKVLHDYDSLVNDSERYNKFSAVVNDIVTDFSATSEELLATMQNMVQAINQITTSTYEEAQGVTSISQKSEVIVSKSENVVTLASRSNEKSEELINLVNQFKV